MSVFRKLTGCLFLALFAALLNVSSVNAQENTSKQQQKADRKKEEQKKEAAKMVAKGEKQHLAHQTKETRKRMKESQKKADETNYRHKEPFYKRWFFKKKSKR